MSRSHWECIDVLIPLKCESSPIHNVKSLVMEETEADCKLTSDKKVVLLLSARKCKWVFQHLYKIQKGHIYCLNYHSTLGKI